MSYTRSQFEPSGLIARQFKSSKAWNPLALLSIVSLWIASVGNWALWSSLQRLGRMQSAADWGNVFCLFALSALILMALLSLLAWRGSIKMILSIVLVVAAISAHFMLSYGIVIDPGMMSNALQTDWRETRDLLTGRMLLTVLLIAGVPMLWLWTRRVKEVDWLRQGFLNAIYLVAVSAGFVLILAVFYQGFSSLMRNHTSLRYQINPLNSIYSFLWVTTPLSQQSSRQLRSIGLDAKLAEGPKNSSNLPPLLLLVVGETARADHFSLNGYSRETNPRLGALMRSKELLSFKNVWSCGTNTAASLPCMFSHLGKTAYEVREHDYENLLDVLQRAGLAVLWIDNQSGCKGVCDRVPNTSTTALTQSPWCSSGECHDEIMLQNLEQRINDLPAERRKNGVVVVLHAMGSHGPAYHLRVPTAFKKFQPECTSSQLADCSREQIINSYDNTIHYADHVLFSSIEWLKKQTKHAGSALVYIADHGESLGENGIYLHGLPYKLAPDAQKHVPWITWLSPTWRALQTASFNCLAASQDRRLSHDHLFHSVLGLMQVQTQVYQEQLDVFKKCR